MGHTGRDSSPHNTAHDPEIFQLESTEEIEKAQTF